MEPDRHHTDTRLASIREAGLEPERWLRDLDDGSPLSDDAPEIVPISPRAG